MLASLALIFLLGLCFGKIFDKLRFSRIFGMILVGIILGPHVLNLIDIKVLDISADLRQIALVIILTRAGLSLDINDLKKVGRPAILMCFIPAIFEIIGFVILGPAFLGLSLLDSAILGTVIAAVSPAVIVPRMIKLLNEGYGVKKSVPQLIMASSAVDDIFVIVLFTSFTGLAQGRELSAISFLQIPVSITLGIILGIVSAFILVSIFKRFNIRDSEKVVIILSVSFLLITLENLLKEIIPISGLLAIMSMGVMILNTYEKLAKELSIKYNQLWSVAEILLFVLVGATVDIKYAFSSGLIVVFVILASLILRMIGVFICLIKTDFTMKERIFCMVAYIPKATVQAAIGGVPLAMGLGCGQIVLTVAVLAILITAPCGAFGIDNTYKRLLNKDKI